MPITLDSTDLQAIGMIASQITILFLIARGGTPMNTRWVVGSLSIVVLVTQVMIFFARPS